jgi:hypothetical protein
MAKLRNAQLRETHFAMAENHGGMGWGARAQGQTSVDVCGEGSTTSATAPAPETFQGLSLLQGRSFSDPDKLTDDCNLADLKDLAGCAIILKDCSFKLQEVDALLIEGMDMRFTLDSVLNVEDEFPFGVALPVGSFLDLLINPKAPSGLALIETLFRRLIRLSLSLSDIVLSKGQGGLVKDFEVNVAARVKRNVVAEAEVVETSPGGGEDSVAGRSRQQKKKAADSAKPMIHW